MPLVIAAESVKRISTDYYKLLERLDSFWFVWIKRYRLTWKKDDLNVLARSPCLYKEPESLEIQAIPMKFNRVCNSFSSEDTVPLRVQKRIFSQKMHKDSLTQNGAYTRLYSAIAPLFSPNQIAILKFIPRIHSPNSTSEYILRIRLK